MARTARPTGLIVTSLVALLILLLILLWDWNWFRPLVQARASAALGRPVTIGRLHVHLARITQITIDDIVIDNPRGFDNTTKFATIPHLTVRIGLFDYIFHGHLVLPLIDVEQPTVDARQLADGRSNWALGRSSSGSQQGTTRIPDIGDLRVVNGHARVRIPRLKADFALAVATQAPGAPAQPTGGSTSDAGNPDNQIIASANGTYAAQKITGRFVGGALLSLRDASKPYPVDLALVNGATTISLVGTIEHPLAFTGADLRLKLAGKDMSDLFALTGVPIPPTPPYHVAGNLDYAAHKIRFRDLPAWSAKAILLAPSLSIRAATARVRW